MLVYLETGCGACLKEARSVKAAEAQTLREVGTTNGVRLARKATERDIAWVTGMGGRNPAAEPKARCTSPTCHVRDLCARFMDSPAGPRTPYADLTNECQDIGSERMFIPFKPTK